VGHWEPVGALCFFGKTIMRRLQSHASRLKRLHFSVKKILDWVQKLSKPSARLASLNEMALSKLR
jgi:hypothetical protein